MLETDRRRSIGFAIAVLLGAIVLAAAVLLVLSRTAKPAAAAPPGTAPPRTTAAPAPASVFFMPITTCFDRGADENHVTPVGCDGPHDEEIFSKERVGSEHEVYVGPDQRLKYANLECHQSSQRFFGQDRPPAGLQIGFYYPTEEAWNQHIQLATCTFKSSQGPLVGQVRP